MIAVILCLSVFFIMGSVWWLAHRIATRASRRRDRLRHRLDVKANYHQEWPGWNRSWFPAWKHHKPRFRHISPRKGTAEELERRDNRHT